MGGASYMNTYPIMSDTFCDTVGVNTATGILNCSKVDYDSLLLGGCWCHTCLPANPCLGGANCVNYDKQGYTCSCAGTGRTGDHCQTLISDAFPWMSLPTHRSCRALSAAMALPSLPTPPQSSSPPPPPLTPPPPPDCQSSIGLRNLRDEGLWCFNLKNSPAQCANAFVSPTQNAYGKLCAYNAQNGKCGLSNNAICSPDYHAG